MVPTRLTLASDFNKVILSIFVLRFVECSIVLRNPDLQRHDLCSRRPAQTFEAGNSLIQGFTLAGGRRCCKFRLDLSELACWAQLHGGN